MFVGEKLVFEMRDSIISIKSKSLSSSVRSAWSWSKFFEREQTLGWNIEWLFWFYVTWKVAKVFWISIFIKTFKELVSSLLDSSVKLSRFLIKWLNDLIKVHDGKKRFFDVVVVSLAFPCLLQKGKIFEVQVIQNHRSAVLLSIS